MALIWERSWNSTLKKMRWMINCNSGSLSGWHCSLCFSAFPSPRCLGTPLPLLQECFMDLRPLERSENFLDIPKFIHLQLNNPALYSAVNMQCVWVCKHSHISCLFLSHDQLKTFDAFSQFTHHNFSWKDIIFDWLWTYPFLIHWPTHILTPNMYVSVFFYVPVSLFFC